MSRVQQMIDEGHLRVVRPRGLDKMTHAFMPLKEGVRYRTSWDPRKGHLAKPGTDYSFCGLGLCPPDDPDFGIVSGWDQVWWFVEDDRDSKTWCRQCTDGWAAWQTLRRQTRQLPTDSPVTQDEWREIGERKMRPLNQLEERKWQQLLSRLNSVLPMEEVTE